MANLAYMSLSAVAATLVTCLVFVWWHHRKRTRWARQATRLRGERDQITEELKEAQKQIALLEVARAVQLSSAAPTPTKVAVPVWFDIPTGDSMEPRLLPADEFAETMPVMPGSSRVR